MFIVHCLLFIVHGSWFMVHGSSFFVHCSLFIFLVHSSSFIIKRSLFIVNVLVLEHVSTLINVSSVAILCRFYTCPARSYLVLVSEVF